MALTTTSLAGSFSATSLAFNATSATGATVGGFARVDGEFMRIQAIDGVKITVFMRGDFGTTAVAHDTLAPLTFGLYSDLANLPLLETVPVPSDKNIVAIGTVPAAATTLAAVTRDTHYVITAGAALANVFIPDPSKSQDGLELTFTSLTDFAHVVKFTNMFDGTTGTSTTVTAPAFKGCSFTVVAFGGNWLTKSNALWVIT